MYVFQADTYCDSCGERIARAIDASGERVALPDDSDHYPQSAREEETDYPDHCASGSDCLEAILSDGLTEAGVTYTAEMLAPDDPSSGIYPRPTPYQRALHALWRETFDPAESDPWVVVENVLGYLSNDDDPPTFAEYGDAVTYLNERAQEYADDADGNYRVEYGYASSGNYAAVMVWDDDKTHDLGLYIGVERTEA